MTDRNLKDYETKYEKQPFEEFQVLYRRKKIKEFLQSYKHDCLLEIGCGLNPIFNDVDSFKELYIVEPAGLFYNNALQKSKALAKKDSISIFNELLENCVEKLSSERFDFILLSSLLHEVPEPKNLLKQVYKLCSQDSILHINVPNAKSFHRLLAVEMGLIKNEHQKSENNIMLQQQTIFDIETLAELTEQCGFKIVERGSYFLKPFAHSQMAEMFKLGLITIQMLDGFYNMVKYMPDLGSEIYVNVVRK